MLEEMDKRMEEEEYNENAGEHEESLEEGRDTRGE